MILLKAENSGGVLTPDAPIYVSSVNWVYMSSAYSYRNILIRHKIDREYWDLVIQQLISQEMIVVRRDELPECFLKNLYIAENIAMSVAFKLDIQPAGNPQRLLYATINFGTEVDTDAPEFKNELASSISKIKNVSKNLI